MILRHSHMMGMLGRGARVFDPASLIDDYGGFILDAAEGLTVTSAPDIDSWACSAGNATYGPFSQATAAAKPHEDTLGGFAVVDCDNAAAQNLRSDAAASAFSPFHKAQGASVLYVSAQRRGQDNYWTGNVVGTEGMVVNSATGLLATGVFGASGAIVAQVITGAYLSVDTLALVDVRHFDDWGLSIQIDDNTAQRADIGSPYSAAAATYAWEIAARGDGALAGDVSHAYIMATPEPLNDEDREAMRVYLADRFSIAGTYDLSTGVPALLTLGAP